MFYKTPQKLDSNILNFAKTELNKQNYLELVLWNVFWSILGNLFLSNFKNLYRNIKRCKTSTLSQMFINISLNLLRLIMPASIIFHGQFKIKH